MSKMKTLQLLAAGKDCESLQDILKQLQAKGFHVKASGEKNGRKDITIAALSEAFYADEELCAQLLGLIAAGAENVLPLQIDASPVPDRLKNALYSRNIIPAADRDASLIAERITAALPERKSRLPLLLGVSGAVLLVIIGIVISFSLLKKQNPSTQNADSGPFFDLPANSNITQEDLEKVRCVVIIGEHFVWYSEDQRLTRPENNEWPDMLYELAYFERPQEEPFDPRKFEWFWHEDGSRVTLTSYDLRFLAAMPNLEELHMAKADLTEAPDLSGLKKLHTVWAYDCRMDNLDWLAETNIHKAQIRCDVDLMPLVKCGSLRCAILDVYQDAYADLSSFSPPLLEEFDLVVWDDVHAEDLSGLKACPNLREVRLVGGPLEDLSFLEGLPKLDRIMLSLHELKDISALRQMTSLRSLDLSGVDSLRDYSPISGCTELKQLRIDDQRGYLRDASFIGDLSKLEILSLQFQILNDLAFLRGIGTGIPILDLSLCGHVSDYSGLSAVKSFKKLTLDTQSTDLNEILPYLENASLTELHLTGFRNVDLSALPRITSRLILERCRLQDLSTMPDEWTAMSIELQDCPALRSLKGLQNQSRLGRNGTGTISVCNCPLLFDWSALNGMDLHALEIEACFSLPDFSDLKMTKLRIVNVPDVTDLSFLDALDASSPRNFELLGLEAGNLAPLRRFSGQYLAVGPQLEDQASELVQAGNFNEYRVEFTDGGWEPDLSGLMLASLDELDELPKALLKRISRFCIAGDRLYDPEEFSVREDWSRKDRNGIPAMLLEDRQTGECFPIDGGFLTDLTPLTALTGLRELRLYCQPLESIDGIQYFTSLEDFTADCCSRLKDVSPLFAVPTLRRISLRYSPVQSIRGIQNLTDLTDLHISYTRVNDLSPLAECSFESAYNEGGFALEINNLPLSKGGLDAIGCIRVYRHISFWNLDPTVWMPLLKDSDIFQIAASEDLRNNEDLAALAADHPELRNLYIGHNRHITDLTPLLPLESLEEVTVHKEMNEAIHSLDGYKYGFELIAEG